MAWGSGIDAESLKAQVETYRDLKKAIYDGYARALGAILQKARDLYAPLGIVQARPKSISSFAEKAARKSDRYDDAVSQITDLCAARVIVNTPDDIKAIGAFIRREFIVDEPNTSDAGGRLREQEFGYQSYHFVVQLAKSEILGLGTKAHVRSWFDPPGEDPPRWRTLNDVPSLKDIVQEQKAEIQVRTVAQHAWAAVTHDRLYKCAFTPPPRLRRLAHRAAALLEDADEALNIFETEMQSLMGSYAAYLNPDELAREIEISRFVLSIDQSPASALRLARLLHATRDSEGTVSALKPHESVTGPLRLPILVALGEALMEQSDKAEGAQLLREAAAVGAEEELDETPVTPNSARKLRAAALALLADRSSEPEHVCERYAGSLELDPHDPYILCAQLAYNLEHTNQPAIIDSVRPAILDALKKCRAHIDVGLQLPQAWFTMGRLHLLLRHRVEALDSYAKGIRFYLADGSPDWRPADFDAEISFLQRVGGRTERDLKPENRWARRLLRMGYWLKTKPATSIAEFLDRSVSFSEIDPSRRVLIVAGGTRPEVQEQMESYRDLLKTSLDRFDGVVVSGGTAAGIPGLVGEVAAELESGGRRCFDLIGYRPEFVRSVSEHYDRIVASGQEKILGLAEPLQMWLDILAAGVNPSHVRLLGINGGRISHFEYALALANGALVGLVESSGRSADLVLSDPDWRGHPRLLPLPNDPMTAQAFTRVGASTLPAEELERMGKNAHDLYREGVQPDYRKPNTLPWEALPAEYRKSSCDQAAYMFEILRGSGVEIKRVSTPQAPITVPEALVDTMARQEHGRWNFGRLLTGWRRAPEKNLERKLTPYLKPWIELPEEVREYDRKSVRAFPRILASEGYQLTPPRHE